MEKEYKKTIEFYNKNSKERAKKHYFPQWEEENFK